MRNISHVKKITNHLTKKLMVDFMNEKGSPHKIGDVIDVGITAFDCHTVIVLITYCFAIFACTFCV